MHEPHILPSYFWTLPFILLLLSIAILPLIPRVNHWWEHNRNKLLVSAILGAITLAYYGFRGHGFHEAHAGLPSVMYVINHAILADFIPFIVLLFSLFAISGGIRLSGDIPAHTAINAAFLGAGAVLANFIGTTGASMLLIRPLLQVNRERENVRHTVIFFIFLVSNVGGLLLPVGDPPLLLGFFRGVPFLWTLQLIPYWVFCVTLLLVGYCIIDTLMYRREPAAAIRRDETIRVPMKLEGKANFILLALVVGSVALLAPGTELPGTDLKIPNIFLREMVLLGLVVISFVITDKRIRIDNQFNFGAIAEVACLFIGIFLTMQVPVEILQIQGADLGLSKPLHFFWATGVLSSFLDNAPTYIVFFETAGSFEVNGAELLQGVATATGAINQQLLAAISCGAVFMGANTYIGNGPNFMVKAIAEQSGVRMPSFFGYMAWSIAILIPLFVLLSFVFFR